MGMTQSLSSIDTRMHRLFLPEFNLRVLQNWR